MSRDSSMHVKDNQWRNIKRVVHVIYLKRAALNYIVYSEKKFY